MNINRNRSELSAENNKIIWIIYHVSQSHLRVNLCRRAIREKRGNQARGRMQMAQSTRENMTIGLRPNKLATWTVAEFHLKMQMHGLFGLVRATSTAKGLINIQFEILGGRCALWWREISWLLTVKQANYCRCLRSWPVDQVVNALELGYGF